jgi:type IV pilus assembly protein PilW
MTDSLQQSQRHGRAVASSLRVRGFSLVELMVAIVLGLFIVVGLLTLIVSNSISRAELDKSSRQIENGRFALAQLTEDIEHAGFTGTTLARTAATITQTAPPLCPSSMGSGLGYSAAANYVATVPFSVYGTDSTAAAGCISNYQSGTAIIVVSRASTATTTVAAAASGNAAYLQASTCVSETTPFAVATGASGAAGFPLTASNCATAALLRPLIQRVYFISRCNVCTSPSDNQPTLKVAEYTAAGTKTITALVEGIQDMQFDYGIDSDNNGSPDSYSATPAAADWPNVVTVRIHLLAVNEDPSGAWTDTRTYDMGLAEGAVPATPVSPCTSGFCDKYKRHVYSGIARLYNISGQRELQ